MIPHFIHRPVIRCAVHLIEISLGYGPPILASAIHLIRMSLISTLLFVICRHFVRIRVRVVILQLIPGYLVRCRTQRIPLHFICGMHRWSTISSSYLISNTVRPRFC
jgi:hypothetical protein